MAVVDGFPELTHKLETTTGGEPLEDGRQVTDHATAKQSQLSLVGWVSDFNGGERPLEALEELKRLQQAGETFTVITEWGTYDEMIIRRVSFPQRSRGARFTIDLEEIIRVGVTAGSLPPDRVSGPAVGRSGEVVVGRVPLGEPTAPRILGTDIAIP